MDSNKGPTPSANRLTAAIDFIGRLVELTGRGNFIYRGEPEHHDKVSSSLYRQYILGDDAEVSLSHIQKRIVEEARRYTSQTGELEILAELQHYGGKTNLIDFTSDFLIALFFACDGVPMEDGRLILLDRSGSFGSDVEELDNRTNKAIAQKSVFVMPPKGFLEPDEMVTIPKDMKEPILEYLRKSHGISAETIYNDFHGFIRLQDLHRDAYLQLSLARFSHENSDGDFEHPIEHYTQAIALNPRLAEAYCGRGGAKFSADDLDGAIRDFNQALALDPDHSCAYATRGRVYREREDYQKAIEDLSRAIQLNQEFDNETSSIAHYYRAIAYLEHDEQVDLAIQDLNVVIERKLPPGLWEAYHNRGAAHFHKKDWDAAVNDFTQALLVEPESVRTMVARGQANVYRGNYKQALRDFDDAIEIEGDNGPVFQNRGITRLFLSEWGEAKADLTRAMDMGEDLVSPFRKDFGSVAEFERNYSVNIPQDIANMLGG